MGRLIDADTLKVTKIVERKRKLFTDGRVRKVNDWTDVVLLEDIENAPTIDQYGTWIPCSQELPKELEGYDYYPSVIVTLDTGRVADGCYRTRDREWWVDAEDGEHYSINATDHVLAWMPLPEPYKGEK